MNSSRKVIEYLLLMFLLGAFRGYLDVEKMSLAYFIGSGLATMFVCLLFGYLINYVVKLMSNKKRSKDHILDATIDDDRNMVLRRKDKLRNYKFGVLVAVLFILLSLFSDFPLSLFL